MATFAITTPVNIDTLAGKTGTDTYNINGGYLTVDQDSRYGTNQATSSIIGPMTLSPTLGGTVEFNATAVRIIPYDGGGGVVPASNTVIGGTLGSGKLIGVYSALNVAPTAAGAAMPATGFIKIKQWDGDAYGDNEVLTGITATVNGTDRAGWIEIVGADAQLCTVGRLGTFKVRGDWFDLGTTDGVRATTYQIPSNGAIVYLPGVWVETAAGSGVYEFYPCAGSASALVTIIATDEVRGRWCWISTAGLLRFGHDGTNSTGGFIPEAGRNVRIPNIFFMTSTNGAPTVNTVPHVTLATRYEFSTTGGAVIDIDKACVNWFLNLAQAFSVTLSNTGIMTQLVVTECASPITWNQVGVGQEAANSQLALSMAFCFAGGTITDCVWSRAAQASSGHYIVSLADMIGFTFANNRTHALGTRGNANTGAYTASRVNETTWTDALLGGGRMSMVTCADCSMIDTVYYDHAATTTQTSIPQYAFEMITVCARILFDGITFGGLTLVQPYQGILGIGAAGCTDIKLRNVGSYASPLDLGGAQQNGVAWTRVTTTATVTKVAHGLKVNDIVYVLVSSSIAAIIVGAKTVLAVPTADTFTFACLNAGAASGTLTYYPIMSAYVLSIANTSALNDIRLQRVYAVHARTNLMVSDNSSKNVLLESVFSDYINAPLTPMLNGQLKGVGSTLALTAQTSCYGTHWVDMFIAGDTVNLAAQAWTRVTTTATVTSVDHNLRTGLSILVTVTSSAAAIILGLKVVTVLDKDTFTFTCLNAGSASGTLTFEPLVSRIGLLMNEKTAEFADVYTIDSGTPGFTSGGSLVMALVNDQITYETPDYVLGHTGFPIAEPVMVGGTLANYHVTYALDRNDGSGYGAFHNAYYPRPGGGGAGASTTVTMTDTTGVEVGDYVYGTNVGWLAKVVSVDSATNITVDTPNLGTVSGILRFGHHPSEAAIGAAGFKMKVRIRTAIASALGITSLYFITRSTPTSRAYQYPLDLGTVELTGLKNPTEVRLFAAGTATEIPGTGNENVTSGTFTAQVDVAVYPSIDISILSLGYQNTRLLAVAVDASGVSIPVQQQLDRQYLNP